MEQYLVILFVKLAVSASLASILARPSFVQRLLLLDQRDVRQRLTLTAVFTIVYGASVATRVLTRNSYQAVDLGLEGSLLCGLVGGYLPGLVGGVAIALPAMASGEYLSAPLFAGLGVVGGLLRDLAPDHEEIWRFSPLFDLNLYRLVRQRTDYRRILFQVTFLLTVLFVDFLRGELARSFGTRYLHSLNTNWTEGGVVLPLAALTATLFAVTLPLKVWNNTRNERKLEAQQALLIEARLAALMRQINPHFLFNTLNSVAALIRTNPDQARTMIYRLSNILRRLLRKQENLSLVREELAFLEDYLSIEMVRFGEKLRYEKTVAPEALGFQVPSMTLQPLVENSIKHGLSSKVEGGVIRIEIRVDGRRLLLAVEDDGVGIPPERLGTLFDQQGIGISNVNERLKVLYGIDFRFTVESTPGVGTRTEIEIPQMTPALAAVS